MVSEYHKDWVRLVAIEMRQRCLEVAERSFPGMVFDALKEIDVDEVIASVPGPTELERRDYERGVKHAIETATCGVCGEPCDDLAVYGACDNCRDDEYTAGGRGDSIQDTMTEKGRRLRLAENQKG
jgi:hypothetical protein